MRLRLRISRAILLISLGIMILTIGVEASFSVAAYQHDILYYTQRETEITFAIASALQERSQNPSSPSLPLIPAGLQKQTNSFSLTLLKRDGSILEEQPAGASSAPALRDFANQVLEEGTANRWKPGGNILETGVALTQAGSSEAAVLIRETNMAPDLASARQETFERISGALLMSTLIGLLVYVANRRLTTLPMKQMQEVAERIFNGDLSPRVAPVAVVELNQIGEALNRMLDRFQAQRSELEKLNRNQEETIRERTSALESANAHLSRQTRGLSLLNSIVTAGTSTAKLDEFCRDALKEIVNSLDAESGILTIQSSNAIFPPFQADAPPKEDRPEPEAGSDENTSTLSSAVYGQDDILGQVDISSPQKDFWGEEDRILLNLIGQQLGVTAERIQAYQQSRETNWMMARLISSSEQLNQYFHQTELFPIIGRGALSLASAVRGAVFNVDADGKIVGVWSIGISQRFLHNLVEFGLDGNPFNTEHDIQPILIYNIEQLAPHAREWWLHNSEGIQSAVLIPLIYEGKISAYAACFYDDPGLPGFAHVELLEAFARQAATSLENTRLIEAERQQRNLAEALRDVSAALTSTLDSDEVFERILINLGKVVKHDAASIMMIEGERLHVIRGNGYPTPDGHPEERNIPVNFFPHVAAMVRTGEAVIIPNTYENPDWVVTPETRWMYSYAGAPVCARGEVIGIINLIGRERDAFSASQIRILRTFADQAAIAIENARIFQATRRKMTESTTLYRALTGLLSPGSEGREISERIVKNVTTVLKVSNCGLFFIDREQGLISPMTQESILSEMALDGAGLIPAAARLGETIYAMDVAQDPRCAALPGESGSELAIPLFAGGKPFAVLDVERSETNGFDPETRQILSGFAERASLVLENARLLETAREQSRCSALLNEIARAALENSDIYASLEQIVRQTAELVKADSSYITLWDETRRETIPLVAWGLGSEGFAAQDQDPGVQSLTARMIKTGKGLAIANAQDPAEGLPPYHASFLAASILGVPLMTGGQRLGAILTGFREKRLISRREIGLLEQAAIQIALGMAKIRLLEATRRRAEESERLRQATAALTTQLNFDEVIKRIAQHLPSLIQYDELAIFIVREGVLIKVQVEDPPAGERILEKEFPLDDPLFMQMSETRQPVVLPDAQQDPRFQNWGASIRIQTWAGVPLFAGDQVVGNISLGRFDQNPFLAEEILLVQVFANQAGAALQNALLHLREQQLAITDPLTRLYNRRGFETLAHHELERSLRFGRPLTLMMVDIDRFKLVNDTYGHSTGDEVLREMSRRIQESLREIDLICRYGGEEFCIILPESEPKGAFGAAERLRQSIEDKPFIMRALSIPITISIGLACMTNLNQGLEELIDYADAALLRSKAAGRNRVTVMQIPDIESGNASFS